MDELPRFLIAFVAIALAATALHRVFGAAADPFAGLAFIHLIRSAWAAHRKRQAVVMRTLAVLRAYDAEERQQLLLNVESAQLREALARELERDGTETSNNSAETFPFPERYRRYATIRYWRGWALSAIALSVAAFVPEMSSIWRALWSIVGVILVWRARRYNRWYDALTSVIEINSYRIAQVWPNGTRLTISFADGAHFEDVPEHRMLVIKSGAVEVPVSYHLIAFNRIAELLQRYAGYVPPG